MTTPQRKNFQQRRTNETVNLAFEAYERGWSRDHVKSEAKQRTLRRNPNLRPNSVQTPVSEALLCFDMRHDLGSIIARIDNPALSATRFHHKLMNELRTVKRRTKMQVKLLDELLGC